MSAGSIAIDVLLAAGVGVLLFCCLGVIVMRGPYARLHYTGPAGLGAACVAIAILIGEGFSLIADKALLIAAFLIITGPVLSHASARAAHLRGLGADPRRPPRGGAGS